MALKNILQDVAINLGLSIDNADELEFYTEKVNQVARELYDSSDLPGSLREQVFQIDDSATYQISLPYYIDEIRAIRQYNTVGGKVRLEDMRPRYHAGRWGSASAITFRVKQNNAALARDISNAGLLTFSFPTDKVEAVDVTITVVGGNSDSARIQETVTIAAGASEITTVNGFETVDSIRKSDTNTYDITITDIDDVELGVIHNSELNSSYTIVGIREDDLAFKQNNSFPMNTYEVLYKQKFSGFVNLYDEFPCPKFDKIIYWKFIEHYNADKPGFEQRAYAAKLKADDLINQLKASNESGKIMTVQYGENPMFKAQRQRGWSAGGDVGQSPIIEYTP